MTRATIRFVGAQSGGQILGGPDGDSLIGDVDFALILPEGIREGLRSRIKLTAGASYSDGMIEASIPAGYDGPWNHQAFTAAVRDYYLNRIVHVAPGARPRDVVIGRSYFGVMADYPMDVDVD